MLPLLPLVVHVPIGVPDVPFQSQYTVTVVLVSKGPPPEVTVTSRPGDPESGLRVRLLADAAYGPTSGPPSPTGAAPAGCTEFPDPSAMARARSSRPFPALPLGSASAVPARRPTTTPFVAFVSAALSSPAAPATAAADAEVPLTVAYPLPGVVV